jgi:AcrR family transcriptional regulator
MHTDTESTRRRILSVTAQLLAAAPDGDVSNREVCEAAGVTPPTLYHHFGDKLGLLQAVVSDAFDRYLEDKHKAGSTGDAAADLRRGWDLHIEFGVANPTLYELMYGRPPSRLTSPAAATARTALRQFVVAIEAQGRLMFPVDTTTEALEAAAVGVTLQLIRSGEPSPRSVSHLIRDSLVASLISPAPPAPRNDVPQSLARAADSLRAELPHGAVGPLRAVETALLHTWLDSLTGRPAQVTG